MCSSGAIFSSLLHEIFLVLSWTLSFKFFFGFPGLLKSLSKKLSPHNFYLSGWNIWVIFLSPWHGKIIANVCWVIFILCFLFCVTKNSNHSSNKARSVSVSIWFISILNEWFSTSYCLLSSLDFHEWILSSMNIHLC